MRENLLGHTARATQHSAKVAAVGAGGHLGDRARLAAAAARGDRPTETRRAACVRAKAGQRPANASATATGGSHCTAMPAT